MILSSFFLPSDFEKLLQEHPLFEMGNIYKAYLQCRRRKRNTVNAMRFAINLEENLFELRNELMSGSYQIGRSVAFMVEKPKKREIFAADFKDRIVHHLLVEYLEAYWEKRFISDSYSCRKGKGTHAAVDKLQSYILKSTKNNTQDCWYLQLDIKGYFTTLDKNILFDILSKKERDSVVLWLLHKVIINSPVDNCLLRGSNKNDFLVLPEHKTLFKAKKECGLPIGNLTSQFFGNVYLDILDQFIKHELKCKYYLRYCDDFILLSADKNYIEKVKIKISNFLNNELNLELNIKSKFAKVSSGINFLGYVTKPKYKLTRRRVIGNLYDRIRVVENKLILQGLKRYSNNIFYFPWDWELIEKLYKQLNSYIAHFNKAKYYNLMSKTLQDFPWLNEYFIFSNKNKIMLSMRYTKLKGFKKYYQQINSIKKFPAEIIMIQKGIVYEIYSSLKLCVNKIKQNFKLEFINNILLKESFSIAVFEEGINTGGIIKDRFLVCHYAKM